MQKNNKKLILIYKKNSRQNITGFSLVELVITVGIISTLSGLAVPSFLNWIRVERVNSYTRELKEYLRIVRLESRRWGASCFININPIKYNSLIRGQQADSYSVSCRYSVNANSLEKDQSKIGHLVPKINNSIFQVINTNFQVTPNGRISSEKSIVVVIGSSYHNTGPKILNCLVIKSPTGHIEKGKFILNDWVSNKMDTSQLLNDDIIKPSNCRS